MHKSDEILEKNLEELVQNLADRLNTLLHAYDEQAKEIASLRKQNLILRKEIESTQWHPSFVGFKKEDIIAYISCIDSCIDYLKANKPNRSE